MDTVRLLLFIQTLLLWIQTVWHEGIFEKKNWKKSADDNKIRNFLRVKLWILSDPSVLTNVFSAPKKPLIERFFRVPTTYVLFEKQEKKKYAILSRSLPWFWFMLYVKEASKHMVANHVVCLIGCTDLLTSNRTSQVRKIVHNFHVVWPMLFSLIFADV